MNAETKPLGFPDYFAYALIGFKVLGAFAIIYPGVPEKIKEWAYAGFTFNLIFAFISHASIDKFIWYMLMPVIVMGILAIFYFTNYKIQLMHKKDYQTIVETQCVCQSI